MPRSRLAIVAVLLALAPTARADFTLLTSASGISGDVASIDPLPTSGSLLIGDVPVDYSHGGLVVQTSGGATVFFLDSATTGSPSAAGQESIYVAAPPNDTEQSSISFTTNFTVMGPNPGSFSQTSTLMVAPSAVGGSTAYLPTIGLLSPQSQAIGGDNFFIARSGSQSGAVNDASLPVTVEATIKDGGPVGSTAVPEPSSLALCGLGAAGLAMLTKGRKAGCDARRAA